MKRLVFVVALPAIALVGCQRQAAPARTAQAVASPSPALASGSAEAFSSPSPASTSGSAERSSPAPGPAIQGQSGLESAAEPAPSPTPAPVVVAAGTALPLVFKTTVASDKSSVGDLVLAELAEDVAVKGRVALPAGSEVRGRVAVAVGSGRVKGRARLAVEFQEVVLNGHAHAIVAAPIDVTAKSTKGRDAKVAGGAAAAGALIGAIAGGGKGALKGGLIGGAAGGAVVVATKGAEVVFQAGSRRTVKLESSLRLD
jgi:hypothetical protein